MPSSLASPRIRSSYSGSVIGPKMSTCTLPRMFMPAPWITRTLGIALSLRTRLQLHHPHPEHGLAGDVNVVLADEGERAVVADAEHRQSGREGPDRVAVSHVHREIVLGHEHASTRIDVKRARMDGARL